MRRMDLLGEVVGVEKRLFFLMIERIGGRTFKTHGRIIQFGQFSLARQQTASGRILVPKRVHKVRTQAKANFQN